MPRREDYQPVPVRVIDGFVHETFQGIEVAPKQVPFRPDRLEPFNIVVIEPKEDSDEESDVGRISRRHGRSFSFDIGGAPHIIWNDEYNNIFTAHNTKGNNAQYPYIMNWRSNTSKIAINGFQDSDGILRAIKASHYLRSRQIPTEAILRVIEPSTIPVGETIYTRTEFISALIDNLITATDEEREQRNIPSVDDIPRIAEVLSESTLFITGRGMPVNERIADFANPTKEYETEMLERTFLYINLVEKRRAKHDPEYVPNYFNAEYPEDRHRYFQEYLPHAIGTYLGRLHRSGAVHGFLHSGNLLSMGAFVDGDSITGEPLGDAPITVENVLYDLKTIFSGGWKLFPNPSEIAKKRGSVEPAVFEMNIAKAYSDELGITGDPRYHGFLYNIAALMRYGNIDYATEIDTQVDKSFIGQLYTDDEVTTLIEAVLQDPADDSVIRRLATEKIALLEEKAKPTHQDDLLPFWSSEMATESQTGVIMEHAMQPALLTSHVREWIAATPGSIPWPRTSIERVYHYFIADYLFQKTIQEDNRPAISLVYETFDEFSFEEAQPYMATYVDALENRLNFQFRIELSKDSINNYSLTRQEELMESVEALIDKAHNSKKNTARFISQRLHTIPQERVSLQDFQQFIMESLGEKFDQAFKPVWERELAEKRSYFPDFLANYPEMTIEKMEATLQEDYQALKSIMLKNQVQKITSDEALKDAVTNVQNDLTNLFERILQEVNIDPVPFTSRFGKLIA